MVNGTACAMIHFHTGPLEKSIFCPFLLMSNCLSDFYFSNRNTSGTLPSPKVVIAIRYIAFAWILSCHKNLRKKIKWFSPNGRNYYCVAFCNKHGNLKAKIRVRKTDEGGVYIVKTTKFISEHEVEEIMRRREKAAQMRQMKRASAKGK